MHREFSKLEVLPVREGRDDYQRNEEVVAALIEETPDLVAIYNVGAGNRGVIAALEVAGRGRDVVTVAHELTTFTRRGLVVLGKRMEDHLRFAVAYWHTFVWPGGDPFGGQTFERPWFETIR
jgi:hypothetical protein